MLVGSSPEVGFAPRPAQDDGPLRGTDSPPSLPALTARGRILGECEATSSPGFRAWRDRLDPPRSLPAGARRPPPACAARSSRASPASRWTTSPARAGPRHQPFAAGVAALARALRPRPRRTPPPLPRLGSRRRQGDDQPPNHPRRPADDRAARRAAGARLRRGLGHRRQERPCAALVGDRSATPAAPQPRLAPVPRRPFGLPHDAAETGNARPSIVADLHAAAARFPTDEPLRRADRGPPAREPALRGALEGSVRPLSMTRPRKTIDHPELGHVTVDCDVLTAPPRRSADHRLQRTARLTRRRGARTPRRSSACRGWPG